MWSRDLKGDDLLGVLMSVEPERSPLQYPGLDPAIAWDREKLGLDCHEVYPDVFIGDAATVRDKHYLKEIRITHVVNCAEGRRQGQLPLSASYFRDVDIEYLGLPLEDIPSCNIQEYFHCASQFIDCALFNGGRVFINCVMGVSRSAAITIAFLMLRRGMSAQEAIHTVRRWRDVWPNAGFLQKLAELHNQLRRRRCPQKSSFFRPLPYSSIGAPSAQP